MLYRNLFIWTPKWAFLWAWSCLTTRKTALLVTCAGSASTSEAPVSFWYGFSNLESLDWTKLDSQFWAFPAFVYLGENNLHSGSYMGGCARSSSGCTLQWRCRLKRQFSDSLLNDTLRIFFRRVLVPQALLFCPGFFLRRKAPDKCSCSARLCCSMMLKCLVRLLLGVFFLQLGDQAAYFFLVLPRLKPWISYQQ